jgi:2-keto-4-pentenoate hydratase/2-oxohepta-3-ene-1,7-dioic acid hydratase in catechol pathway
MGRTVDLRVKGVHTLVDDDATRRESRMSTWSLVSVRPEDGSAPRVAASCDGRLTSIPALEGYADVADVLAAWPALAPRLRSFDPADGVALPGTVLAPVRSPRKLLFAGANYVDHLREMGISEVPPGLEPYFFLLPPTSIVGPGDAVVIPADPGARIDWEAELAVVIGVPGRDVDEDDALDHVAGYTIVNDVSARGYHRRPNPLAPPFAYDWLASKGRDTFCPLGPGITPSWFVPDPQDMPIRLWRNGELEQNPGRCRGGPGEVPRRRRRPAHRDRRPRRARERRARRIPGPRSRRLRPEPTP